jgi:DNA-damage-inducible protein J
MSKTATIRARLKPELKAEAEEILNELGMTTSESIQLLFNQIRLRGEFPLELKVPNETTRAALKENRRKLPNFDTVDDLMADLDS